MKIYLDYIFLENLIVNTVIINEIIKGTNFKIPKKKKYIVIILETFLSCIINIIPQLDNFFLNIIITSFSLYCIFKFKKIYEFLKTIIYYYLIYILYIGIIIFFSCIFGINLEIFLNKILTYIFSGITLNFLLKDLWKMWKSKIKFQDLYYKLKINNVEINSFVDTGNTVKESITNLNVIFLNKELENIIDIKNNKKINVEILTVNGIDIKEGYIVEDIIVIKDKKEIAKIPKIILCFSLVSNTPEKYSAIIGYDTYLENLNGGVSY